MEAPSPSEKPLPIRHVAGVAVGNALEFYDFVTYAFFSIYIGRAFFPTGSETESLLLSLATFGVGFVMRPVGGIVIGRMADRHGRKPALILSLVLMGVAVTGLALTPSYATIGIAAPIIVIVFRLIQGFALGGQVGPATAYLIEAAPARHRGFYSSLQYASQDVASLAAGVVGITLANTMDAQQLQDWGWRIALLLGSVIVPFGLWLRTTLPETAVLRPKDATHTPVSVRPYARAIALSVAMLGAATIANYTLNYLTTYAMDTLKLPAAIAFGFPIVTGVGFLISQPLSGWLSDRIGRKPMMLIPGVVMLVSILPAVYLVNTYPEPVVLYSAAGLLVILGGLCAPPMLTYLSETVPMAIRAGVVGTVYAFAIAIFGGTTQFIDRWLIEVLGDPLAPAYYLTAAWAVGVVAMALTRESAPAKMKPGR
jgi:MFS family permease